MKKIIAIVILCIFSINIFAQSEQYMNGMKGMLVKMDAAKTPEAYQAVANGFERIANAEKTEWLPKYYAAFCYTMQAMMQTDKDKIDPIADQAEKLVDEGIALNNNDELLCVKSLCKSAKIGVNPMTRGMKMGQQSAKLLEEAKAINPNNPRIYYLQGQSKYYTPEAFGGGKKKAKEYFETAIAKFETFKPTSELMPNWGAEQAKKMLEDCNK